jgi:two-component system sensor histidine kinase YesM
MSKNKKIKIPNFFHLENHKIEQKLLYTYPILIVASILVVSSFAIYFSMDLYREKAISYSLSIMKQVSHNTDIQLTRLDRNSYIFLKDSDIKRFLTAEYGNSSSEYYKLRTNIQSFLVNFLLTNPNVESVFLINYHGDVITTVDNLNIIDPDFYHQQAAIGDGKLVWLKTRTSSMGNKIIPAVRQINDLSSLRPKGTLLIHFRESAVRTLLDDSNLDIQGTMIVIDPEGFIVSSRNAEMLGSAIDPNVIQLIKESKEYFFYGAEAANTFYTFYQSDFTNWTYLYQIPSQVLFTGTNVVRNWIMVVALFFTFVSIITVKVISHNISKPIQHVISEMENVEKNNLLVNLKYEGKDELHTLTHTFNTMMNRIRNLIKKESELQRLKHELEMRALQAEINPHFLYNTLEAINWIGRKNRIPEICDMTKMLADIMRYSIDNHRNLVSLVEELEHVKKYLGIQKLRYGNQLSVFIDVPEEMMEVHIPKLTLQPLVENAIVHGLENQLGKGKLRILGQREGDKVKLLVEDNGCGITSEKIKSLYEINIAVRNHGIGFYNVHKRVQLFFGDSFGLDVFSIEQKGTRITVNLPFERGELIHVSNIDR